MYIGLSPSYPSTVGPLIAFNFSSPFYEPFAELILSELKARWSEETPVLYDLVMYIQDEMIPSLLD